MSLNLEVTKKNIGEISINFDELKKELEQSLFKYKDILVTEENLASAKKDKAMLNKVSKAINDRKIELKREFLAPYEVIENQIKELIGMISEVSTAIDLQVKVFEENDKNKKKEEIQKMWDNIISQHPLPFLTLDACFKDKWLNKTVTLANIMSEMEEFIQKISQELKLLEEMFKGEELLSAKTKYYQTTNLYDTIEKMKLEKVIKESLQNKEEQKAEEAEEKEQEYILQLEIVTTYKNIMALSQFLKANKIKYTRIDTDKEN